MAVVQIASPVGVVAGYVLTTTIKQSHHWTLSYIIQAILFGVTSVSSIFIPINYLSISLNLTNPTDPDKIKEKKGGELNKDISISNISNSKLDEIKEKEEDIISLYDHTKEEDNKAKFFWKTLCILIKVKVNYIS